MAFSYIILLLASVFLLLMPPQQDAVGTALSIRIPETSTTMTATTTTTSTTSTTAPRATSTVPHIQISGENLCSITQQYSWPKDIAYGICIQESGGNPNAQNHNDYHSFANCWGSYGLMQINCAAGKLFDPKTNMDQAFSMWQARGWVPWKNSCKKVAGCVL